MLKLKELAKIKNCELLTTEKDYLRIKKSLRKNVSFLKVELSIDNEKQFYKYLNQKIWNLLDISLNMLQL